MRRAMAVFLAAMVTVMASGTVLASGPLKASPSSVKFGTKPVGSITLKGTRLTNRSDATINILVTGGLPDDFAFGLLPGSTCPVFDPEPLAPGESCVAVVQFRPTEFFAGEQQTATLIAIASDPASGTEVATLFIDFTGTGR
ncbi:MAG: hypothetical protein ACRDGJ_01435 [Candidatus Limnocylindria bacterium]